MGDSTTCIMDSNGSSTKALDLKRSLSGELDHGCRKKIKTNDSSCMKSFVDLSEDVLLILFSHMAHNDLINLARTCTRMDRVVRDWTLWKHINSSGDPIPMVRLKEFIPYVLKCTEEVKLTFESEPLVPGENDTEAIENEESCTCLSLFLSHLSSHCNTLYSLSLEHVTVDAKKFQIQIFPSTLKKFSLAHSKLVNLSMEVSYFYGFDTHFPNIEVLDLSWCSWFTPHSLIALSKSKNLKELYLQGCRKIKNCVPYTSLSVRFGFKALKLLDLRFTYISDSEVTIIYDLPCLTHLYLAAPTPKRLEEFSISDRSITMLCTSNPRNDENGYEQIMRYPSITNITLRHAAACLSGLRLLDVRGSSCTPDAVAQFRSSRPEVTLLAGPDPDPHPPGLIFDPPSPIPLLPGLRVVLHRIENQPVVAVVGGDGNNNAAEEEGEREENEWVVNERERVNEERIEGGNEEEEGNEREGGNEEEEGANEERLEGNEMGNEGEEENEQRRDDEEIMCSGCFGAKNSFL
ncbi:hypothetical protein M8J76_012894 [Diaphorina citri]|nr:hypothetical protein M8J76_012894 [Diaphorina citri]